MVFISSARTSYWVKPIFLQGSFQKGSAFKKISRSQYLFKLKLLISCNKNMSSLIILVDIL